MPTEEAVYIARLFDGAPVDTSELVSEDDVYNARCVLTFLHHALRYGLKRHERLEAVFASIDDRPKTNGERLLRYVEHVAHLVATWRPYEATYKSRRARATDAEDMLRHAGQFASDLERHDPAFKRLSGASFIEAMRSAAPSKGGGAGKFGVDHVAAELAMEVDAFSFVTRIPEEHDKNVASFKQRIREARSDARKRTRT